MEAYPASAAAASPPVEEECTENGGPNAGKRPAWNKPSNGAAEVGPVMGAHSWPALSDVARASANKSSSDSLKGLSDGSSSVFGSQGHGTVSLSPQKQVANNANTNSTPNHTIPSRQKSTKNTPNSSFNDGLSHPPAPQAPVGEGPSNNSSPRDHTHRSAFVSRSNGSNDQPQQRSSFRSRNGGQHPRGDGSLHHNYGGRRDHDRGNQDWNTHRNINGRDAHVQPQRVPRFMRHPPPPPPNATPFIAPPPFRPFGGPMGFSELASPMYYVAAPPPESLRGVPFVAPIPHAVFLPAPDPQLHSRIVNQIDYYFSNENLIKDTYLRQNMDDQGWVSIKLIAGFKKVLNLTDNVQLILDALRSSTVVEIQGDKVRKRGDWVRWIMPPSVQLLNVSATQAQGDPGHDKLAARVQNISLEHNAADHTSARSQREEFLSRLSSWDLNNLSAQSSSEGVGQVSYQGSFISAGISE
ncbi:La domain-containing protein [Cephalotus follicularis]|uniref:La domain-containing protein n=1 Tax=Cephalotus follicularis TaxID=3775 RepID=A0A1Q3C3J3_CEPFO|nr:La domain-containing protein [Cephalotus follicularis]